MPNQPSEHRSPGLLRSTTVTITDTLTAVAALPDAQRLACYGAALGERDEALQLAACRALLDRRGLYRPDLVLDYHADLLPAAQQEVVAQADEFLRLARERIVDGRDPKRLAAYRLVASLGDLASCELLALGVNDVLPEVVATVLSGLLRHHQHLSQAWQEAVQQGIATIPAALGDAHASAWQSLATVLRAFPGHQRSEFMDLLLAFGTAALPMVTSIVLGKRDGALAHAFVKAVNNSPQVATTELLVAMLLDKEPAAQSVATTILRTPRTRATALVMARQLAAVRDERALAQLRAARDLTWLAAVLPFATELDAAVARRLLSLLSGSCADGRRRQLMAEPFLNHQDHRVQIDALELLQAVACPGGFAAIERVLGTAALPVRTAAVRLVLDLDPPNKQGLLVPLLGVADPELRRIAVRELSHGSFGRYFERFSGMSPQARQIAARALAKIDDQLLDRVGDEVASLDPERRLKALQIVGYLDAGAKLRSSLQDLLGDPDRRVRATAIRVLELAGSATAFEALLAALADPDRRIRANAIEAFEQLDDPRFVQMLLPFLHDRDNRVRANACKALWHLGQPEAAAMLREMLADADEAMRLSAVWTLGEIRLPDARELLEARELCEVSGTVLAKLREVLATLATTTAVGS